MLVSQSGISLPPWQRARIQKLARLGYRPGEIVEAMGVSYATVARWRNRDSIEDAPYTPPARTPGRTPDGIEDEVVRLRLAGVMTGEIARQTGVTLNTVAAICKRRGVWVI